MKLCALFVLTLPVFGCSGVGGYYGGYSVTCPINDENEMRAEVERDAKRTASALHRSLVSINQPVGYEHSLMLSIPAPPDPRIVFSFSEYKGSSFWISVAKSGRDEDQATTNARTIVENILQDSRCSTWHYSVSNFSFAK